MMNMMRVTPTGLPSFIYCRRLLNKNGCRALSGLQQPSFLYQPECPAGQGIGNAV